MSPELPAVSARLESPDLPDLQHPEVAQWRPAAPGDVDAVFAAQQAMDAVDHPEWVTARGDIEGALTGESVAADTMLALDEDGAVLAWGNATLYPGIDTRLQALLDGGVVPSARRRGIGSTLLGWQVARAEQHLAARDEALPAWIRTNHDLRNPGAIAMLEAHGFTVARTMRVLERDLSDPIDEVPSPEGITIRPFEPGDAEATRHARNDSFRDHWGSEPVPPAKWHAFVTGETFREDVSVVAVDDESGEVLAFAVSTANPRSWDLSGYRYSYLELLGVVRAGRGRGISPALLAAALGAAKDAGMERVGLDVDADNPTGAVALYERSGFAPIASNAEIVREV